MKNALFFNETLTLADRDKKIMNFVRWTRKVRLINLSDKLLEAYVTHAGLIIF